jgi:hypothetical protein
MNGRLSLALYVLCWLLAGGVFSSAAAQTKPEGEMRWALYVTVAPSWYGTAQCFSTTAH